MSASRRFNTVVVVLVAACIALTGVALAQKSPVPEKKMPAPTAAGSVVPAVTVFVDVAGKRAEAADGLTATHAEMAKRGYTFVQAITHVENGDLQGFFATYAPAN